MLSTASPVIQASLINRAQRLREAEGDAPLSSQDLRAAAVAERARNMAVSANRRKRHAIVQGDTAGARRERGLERAATSEVRDREAKLEKDRADRTDKRWLGRVLEETAELERGRGEEVERRPGGGLRIKSRDGLWTLAFPDRKPKESDVVTALTSVQYRAGLLYRDIFEGSREQLGSQLGALQGSGRGPVSHDPNRKTWAQRRAELTDELLKLEQKVNSATLDPRSVTLLREVTGAGHPISHLSCSGSKREKDGKLLRAALDIVAAHFKVSDRASRLQHAEFATSSSSCAYAERPEQGA